MGAKRLLVVDDQKDFADFVRKVAEDIGFDVTVINESLQFEATYESVDPDVIVLDIVMPDRDGIEIVQSLVQADNKASVIMVTGYNPSYARVAELMASTRGSFTIETLNKPVRVAELRKALQGAS